MTTEKDDVFIYVSPWTVMVKICTITQSDSVDSVHITIIGPFVCDKDPLCMSTHRANVKQISKEHYIELKLMGNLEAVRGDDYAHI